MIASILPSSANFHAIDYNEKKVAQGYATLIEMRNIHGIADMGSYAPEELRQYFIDYSSRNNRIRKPQFHLAISCKGHEYSVDQLRDIAHRYLEKMGYGAEGQPMAMYAHHDTGNTHIHIVTSRVAPDGRKIDHNHERRRSQRIINEIMNISTTKEFKEAIETAKEYCFDNIPQFRAIMSTFGYDCKEERESASILFYKGGMMVGKLPECEVASMVEKNTADSRLSGGNLRERRKRQIKALFNKYHSNVGNIKDFSAMMKKRFGISLVFYGRADSPYGYAIVDHKKAQVFTGKEIMGIKQLLKFSSPGEKKDYAMQIIALALSQNPFSTTSDLNRKIWSRLPGVYIRGKNLWHGSIKVAELQPDTMATIKLNNSMMFAAGYSPSDEIELRILQSVFKRDYNGKLAEFIMAQNQNKSEIRGQLFTEILSGAKDWKSFKQSLSSEKMMLVKEGIHYYIIDHRAKAICRADSLGQGISDNINQLKELKKSHTSGTEQSHQRSRHGVDLRQNVNYAPQPHSISREWEVGSNPYMDDPDMALHRGQ